MITSTGNARVKQLVTWQKKRKARDEEGVYIVEGIRMYREAPRAQVRSCIFPCVRYKDTTGDPACDGAEEL